MSNEKTLFRGQENFKVESRAAWNKDIPKLRNPLILVNEGEFDMEPACSEGTPKLRNPLILVNEGEFDMEPACSEDTPKLRNPLISVNQGDLENIAILGKHKPGVNGDTGVNIKNSDNLCNMDSKLENATNNKVRQASNDENIVVESSNNHILFSNYMMIEGILCICDEQGNIVKKLGNYELKIVAEITKYDDAFCIRKYYRVKIKVYNRYKGTIKEYQKDIEVNRIKDRRWLEEVCESRIYFVDSKIQDYWEYIQCLLDSTDYQKLYVFARCGWIHLNNNVFYLDRNGIVGANDTSIECTGNYCIQNNQIVSNKDTFNDVLNMVHITKDIKCSLPLLILTHISVLREAFSAAGYPAKFIMAYIGETTSKKTSISLVMTRFLREGNDNNSSPTVSFEASICGLEEALTFFPDAVQIVDDYRPANNKAEEKLLQEKLERIIRVVGDNNSVKRMTIYSNGKKVDLKPRTTCLITGEIPCTGNNSSMNRTINVMTDRGQSNDSVLTYYQNNKWILGNHMYDFIKYITDNRNEIICFIQSQFIDLRNRYKDSFKFSRFVDSFIVLHITCDMLLEYGVRRGFIDEGKRTQLRDIFITTLFQVVKSNDNNIEEQVLEVEIANAIQMAVEKGKLKVFELTLDNVKEYYMNSERNFECMAYYDDNYLYIKLEELFTIVRNYNKIQNDYSPFNSKKKLKSQLSARKIIEVNLGKEKREQERLPCGSNFDKQRYLYVKISKLRR